MYKLTTEHIGQPDNVNDNHVTIKLTYNFPDKTKQQNRHKKHKRTIQGLSSVPQHQTRSEGTSKKVVLMYIFLFAEVI